ncbi:uncharacterized protein LOC144478901 [Augochlora pura]
MNESLKRKYDEGAMCQALKAVRSGIPINTAAKKYRVPRSTLYGKYKQLHASDRRGRPTVLSTEAENKIVQWIIDMSRLGCPITKEHLMNSVTLQVKVSNISNKFIHGKPSRHWYQGLRKRHPILIKRISENVTLSRASISESSVRKWFMDTEDYLRKENLLNIDSTRVYNIGETSLMLNPENGQVPAKEESKNVHKVVNNNEEENITVLVNGNARGQLAPTMVVFNYKRVPSSIYTKLPEGFHVGTSEQGLMTASLFYEYIAKEFWPWLIKNKIQMPVILFLDGHVSYLTQLLSEFCREHQIVLIALHPNTTHFLQPMDVNLFEPLKARWKENVNRYCNEREKLSISKEDFAPVLETIFREMNLKEILSNGFRKCGLDPFSMDEVDFVTVFDKKNSNSCKSLVATSSQPCLLESVERYIKESTLHRFKCEKSENWTGREEDKSLFYFWRRILNDSNQSKNMANNCHTPVELVLIPEAFDSPPDQDECIIGF